MKLRLFCILHYIPHFNFVLKCSWRKKKSFNIEKLGGKECTVNSLWYGASDTEKEPRVVVIIVVSVRMLCMLRGNKDMCDVKFIYFFGKSQGHK